MDHPCPSVLLALRMRRACIEPFTGIGRSPLGPLGLHSGYSIIPLYEMAGRAAPRKFCQALLVQGAAVQDRVSDMNQVGFARARKLELFPAMFEEDELKRILWL